MKWIRIEENETNSKLRMKHKTIYFPVLYSSQIK